MNRHPYCPVNVDNNFLPSNGNEAITFSAFKTERFRMMFYCVDIVFLLTKWESCVCKSERTHKLSWKQREELNFIHYSPAVSPTLRGPADSHSNVLFILLMHLGVYL